MANNLSIFDISGRAMSAQLVRLNTTASNLANAGTVSGSEGTAFRAMKPVFRTVVGEAGKATVQVDRINTSTTAPVKRHEPNHPLADKDGNIWEAAVDSAAEMVEMLEASRQYQNNVQVADTIRELPNGIIIRGHTDAQPVSRELGVNNWQLSAARAEATRANLVRSALPQRQFVRIEGVAEREPYIPSNPYDPKNRRMSITLGWRTAGD